MHSEGFLRRNSGGAGATVIRRAEERAKEMSESVARMMMARDIPRPDGEKALFTYDPLNRTSSKVKKRGATGSEYADSTRDAGHVATMFRETMPFHLRRSCEWNDMRAGQVVGTVTEAGVKGGTATVYLRT